MAEYELGPGSEGDAYRYTKKALLALPNVERVRQIYTEVAANRNISSWTRACYQDIRAQFFRDGQCKIKFAPGVARIAFGELELGTGDEEFRKLADLRDFVRIISIAHFTEFTRHLVLNGEEMTFATLTAMYGSTAQDNWKDLKKELRSIKYGPRRYTIVWLDSFETAQQYAKYTHPHTWCHLNSKGAFESYSYAKKWTKSGKQMVSPVKLYLAYLPGYETMGLDDPLYGESMLGIDISPDGRLVHVNNRWNHAHDNIDERKGDNKYSERELSELLGAPFYKVCPPISKRDLNRIVSKASRAAKRRKAVIDQFARKAAAFITRKVTAPRSEGTMTDPATGRTYKTVVEGGLEWMAEPLFRFDAPDIREPGNLAKAKEAVARWWEQRLKETDTTSKEEDLADPVPMIADGLDGILGDPIWEGTYCELHTYTEPATGKTIVYRECDVMGKETFIDYGGSLSSRASAAKIIAAIDKSRGNYLHQLIEGFSISGLGHQAAPAVAECVHEAGGFSRFVCPVPEESAGFIADFAVKAVEKGVSDLISNRFVAFITNHVEAIRELVTMDVAQEVKPVQSMKLAGKVCIMTGTFDKLDRDVFKGMVTSNGGTICSSITKKCNVVLMGDGAGPSKVQKICVSCLNT